MESTAKKKPEGPSCACGRPDLYDVWIKLNEATKNREPLIISRQQSVQYESPNEKNSNNANKGNPKSEKQKAFKPIYKHKQVTKNLIFNKLWQTK